MQTDDKELTADQLLDQLRNACNALEDSDTKRLLQTLIEIVQKMAPAERDSDGVRKVLSETIELLNKNDADCLSAYKKLASQHFQNSTHGLRIFFGVILAISVLAMLAGLVVISGGAALGIPLGLFVILYFTLIPSGFFLPLLGLAMSLVFFPSPKGLLLAMNELAVHIEQNPSALAQSDREELSIISC